MQTVNHHAEMMTVTVGHEPVHSVRDLLFGQMMEHFNDRERGPEALYGTKGVLREDAVRLCREINPSIVRFPGGAMVESRVADWTRLIDPAPGYPAATNRLWRFGYDEFLRMAEDHGWDVILPINFRELLWQPDTWEDEVLHHGGLLAYCHAEPGAELPAGMPDWGALRAKNGHPEPYSVRYVQIGNEWNAHWGHMAKVTGIEDPARQVAHARNVILRMTEILRAIDPDIRIISDAVFWTEEHYKKLDMLYADQEVCNAVDLLAIHSYRPWQVDTNNVILDGQPVELRSLPDEMVWKAMVGAPEVDRGGRSTFLNEIRSEGCGFALAKKHGLPVAMTEWNWNGFGAVRHPVFNSLWAKGVGAAGFLHAIIRAGDRIELATQSMMIGTSWDINSIHVAEGGAGEAYIHPTGAMVNFYRAHAGRHRYEAKIGNPPLYGQPLRLGAMGERDQVAYLDVAVTGDDKRRYVHCINRRFEKAQPVTIRLPGHAMPEGAILHRMTGTLENHPEPTPGKDRYRVDKVRAAIGTGSDGKPEVYTVLPPRSIGIVEIQL